MRASRWLVRAWSATGAAAVMAVLAAAPAWAPHVAQLQVTPATAKPGQQVGVYGPRGYGPTNPVDVRWGSPTGPVLGTFQPNTEAYAQWGPGSITVPADAKAGTYQIYATQNLTAGETYIRGVPSQASMQVVTEGGAAPLVSSGPATASGPDQPKVGLVEEKASSTGRLVLLALGVAGIALFVGGGAAVVVARRPQRSATAERVSPSK